jgi:hypothetical protein
MVRTDGVERDELLRALISLRDEIAFMTMQSQQALDRLRAAQPPRAAGQVAQKKGRALDTEQPGP